MEVTYADSQREEVVLASGWRPRVEIGVLLQAGGLYQQHCGRYVRRYKQDRYLCIFVLWTALRQLPKRFQRREYFRVNPCLTEVQFYIVLKRSCCITSQQRRLFEGLEIEHLPAVY